MTAKQTLTIALVTLLLFAAAFTFGFFAARYVYKQQWHEQQPVIQRDTVIVRDTIRKEVPKPTFVKIRDTVLFAVTDTLRLHDTTFVALPREVKTYNDEDYTAVVSGVMPSLDYIEVYKKTVTITDVVREPAPRWSWGVDFGLTAGYGITPAGMQPFLGVGVTVGLQYRFRTYDAKRDTRSTIVQANFGTPACE